VIILKTDESHCLLCVSVIMVQWFLASFQFTALQYYLLFVLSLVLMVNFKINLILCYVRLFGENLVIPFQDTKQWFDTHIALLFF